MSIPILYVIPRTKKGLIITLAILIAVSIGLAVYGYISWSADQKMLQEKGQPDFNTLAADQLEAGMIVQGNIDLALEVYAEEYESNFGLRTTDDSTSLYYLVPVYDMANDGSMTIRYLITYEADPQEYETMDKVVAQTWSTDPITVELTVDNGEVRALPDDLKGYFHEWANNTQFYENGTFIDWCKEYGIFDTNDDVAIEAKLVPFLINKTATAGTDPIIMWIFGALAILLAVGLILVVRYKHPIKGFEDTPPKEDFNQIKDLGGE
jgi:hypothetical protein